MIWAARNGQALQTSTCVRNKRRFLTTQPRTEMRAAGSVAAGVYWTPNALKTASLGSA